MINDTTGSHQVGFACVYNNNEPTFAGRLI